MGARVEIPGAALPRACIKSTSTGCLTRPPHGGCLSRPPRPPPATADNFIACPVKTFDDETMMTLWWRQRPHERWTTHVACLQVCTVQYSHRPSPLHPPQPSDDIVTRQFSGWLSLRRATSVDTTRRWGPIRRFPYYPNPKSNPNSTPRKWETVKWEVTDTTGRWSRKDDLED